MESFLFAAGLTMSESFLPADSFGAKDSFVVAESFVPADCFVARDSCMVAESFVTADCFGARDSCVMAGSCIPSDTFGIGESFDEAEFCAAEEGGIWAVASMLARVTVSKSANSRRKALNFVGKNTLLRHHCHQVNCKFSPS